MVRVKQLIKLPKFKKKRKSKSKTEAVCTFGAIMNYSLFIMGSSCDST